MATSSNSRDHQAARKAFSPKSSATSRATEDSSDPKLPTIHPSTPVPTNSHPKVCGFPATPVEFIMTPTLVDTPCITPFSTPLPLTGNKESLDELDIMLCHEDFPKLLSLAVQVKNLHINGFVVTQPQENHRANKDGPLEASEVIIAVTRIQERLFSSPAYLSHQAMSVRPPKIARGSYPMTDSLLDESFDIIQQEFVRCQKLAASIQSSKPELPIPTSGRKSKGRTKSKSKDAIAIKYSKWQTDILMQWMIDHRDNPFPDQDDVHKLMHQTNLSYSQIINWTTNVRKRNRKATCEDGKKPHHFLDFLFLADKRESQDEDSKWKDAFAIASLSFSKKAPPKSSSNKESSQKKRKVDTISSPPLLPMMDTTIHHMIPKSASASNLPPLSPSPYYAASPGGYSHYHPEYHGYSMPFPTSPAYYYGPSPYPHQHGTPPSPAYGYHVLPYNGHHNPHSHHYRNPHPQVQTYQRRPPSRPSTPCTNEAALEPIQEEEPTAASPRVKIEPGLEEGAQEPETKLPARDVKIKIEPESPERQNVSDNDAANLNEHPSPALSSGVKIKHEPPTPVSSAGIKIKHEDDVFPPSFGQGTELEPFKIDAPDDPCALEAFAAFWEIHIHDDDAEDCHDNRNERHHGHALYILRDGETFASPDVPTLMEEQNRFRDQEQMRVMPDVVRSHSHLLLNRPCTSPMFQSNRPSIQDDHHQRKGQQDLDEIQVRDLATEFDGIVGV